MVKPSRYVGEDHDVNGGMTTIGKTVRDAKVFGLIDPKENCEGWEYARINQLLQLCNDEWDKYGCLVSNLPEPLATRHREIHGAAMVRARRAGWSGEYELDDDE